MKDCYGHEVPQSAYIIRATEVSEFLNCPIRWGVMSHNGLNLEPATQSPKLRVGTVWHKALEYYYSPVTVSSYREKGLSEREARYKCGLEGLEEGLRDARSSLEAEWGDALYDSELTKSLQEEENLLRTLFDHYHVWSDCSTNNCRDSNYNFVATERRLLVPISTPDGNRSMCYLAVKLDGIAEKGNFVWVWEHKTRGKSMSVSNPDNLDLDIQMGLQILALRKVLDGAGSDKVVRGCVYNLARKQLPSPRVRSPIFGRHEVIRTLTAVDILERFIYRTYRDMRDATQHVRRGGMPGRYNPQPWGGLCTWGCPATHICRAVANGDDIDYLLTVYFKPRSKDIWQVLAEEMSEGGDS